MLPETSADAGVHAVPELLRAAMAKRYDESGAGRYGIAVEQFEQILLAVVAKYAADASAAEQASLVASLQVVELVLARACAAGSEAAWEVFLTRFRAPLYEAAYRIARDEATGRELADELYAELYGLPNRDGRRVCRLDYYMGRGSLEGWLRTVLSQRYIDRYRSRSREVSLDEQLEAGVGFAAPQPADPPPADALSVAVATALRELDSEERFLLASWYLDNRTLADIGRQLRVHESTVSRRLDRLTGALRKRVRKLLLAAGLSGRESDERMDELDVRDLQVNVAATLRQETPLETFQKEGATEQKT